MNRSRLLSFLFALQVFFLEHHRHQSSIERLLDMTFAHRSVFAQSAVEEKCFRLVLLDDGCEGFINLCGDGNRADAAVFRRFQSVAFFPGLYDLNAVGVHMIDRQPPDLTDPRSGSECEEVDRVLAVISERARPGE